MFPVIHRPLDSNGSRYTFHHLQPFRVKLEGHGRDGCDITIRISYHSHVYSATDSNDELALRFIDEGGKGRRFSEARYSCSLSLPQISFDMIKQNFRTWPSKDRNSRNNMAVTEKNAANGVQYVVLYSLIPSKVADIDVELVVKSAYQKDVGNLKSVKKTGVCQLIKTCYFKGKTIPK